MVSSIILILFSSVIINITNFSYPQDPSLVAYWPFDESVNSTAVDVTGNGNDGTLFNGVDWAIGIIGGSALTFDGVDGVVVVQDPGASWNLDITDSLTISAWINPASFTFSGQEKIVSKDNVYEFQVDANSLGSYQVRLNNAPFSVTSPGDTSLAGGVWQHVAFTWDGSNVQYYLGGFPDGGYPFVGPLRQEDSNIGIGARPVGGIISPFHGSIDDVRIYNRALNSSEIQTLFALGAGGDTMAPQRFNSNPSGFLAVGTTDVNISLNTDENAICRFDLAQDIPYSNMHNVFDTTGGTTHSILVTDLAGGTTHRFYVRCQDGVGNTNAEDFLISFSIRGGAGTGFHPTDLNPLMFYIESTFFNDFNNRQRSIATCNTQECFDAPDLITIDRQYCDTVVDQNAIPGARGTAPNGCIRRWEDQSPYISNRADGTELIVGRDFGQDDHEKPLFIPNCINGHPCARGLVKKDPPFTQNTTFEIEVADAFANQGNPPTGTPPDVGLNDDFSIFHLVRPIEQDEDWWYFGCSGSRGLRHNVADNSLFYRCGGAGGIACENQGLLTIPEAIEINQWQLIEIHRDTDDNIEVIVNGEDVSLPINLNAGGGWCYHNVISREKGEADGIMEGDLAASAVYDRNLTEQERQDMRNYLDNIYDFLNDRPIIQPNDHKTQRGYQARACGFDMDDDFIYGEPADDCNVGDGITTDPDGDGVDEDLIYVDCQNGSDSNDGSPGSPFLTLDHALSQANGPGNGAEDIIAFTGVCSPNNITISKSGIPGIKIRPKSGSEERDFEYARNPLMIIGWDKDNDGQYPPFDADDVSELYGGPPNCLAQALKTSRVVAVSNLEIAHFTVREYGTCEPSDTASGFMAHIGPLDQVYSHHYFHDLSIVDVNRAEINGESGTIIHSLFSAGSYKWAAWENQEILNASGYTYRGSSGSLLAGDSGPWRFQGTTRTCFANGVGANSTGTLCTGWKNWRYISQVEILDQIFDMNIEAGWVVDANVANEFVGPVQCVQDWVIRNNKVIDVKTPFVVVGSDEDACTPESDGFPSRPTKDILIEGNIWTNSFRWANSPTQNAGGTCLAIAGCDSLDATVSNVKFYNNVCWSEVDMGPIINVNCLQDFDENPGSYEFINNTLYAGGAITFGALNISNADLGQFAENDITFQNNIVVIRPNDTAIRIPFPLDSFISDNNTFSPNSRFFWEGVNVGLGITNWYNASGQDFNSFDCRPTFVDELNGDLHLDANDACALNFGADMSRDIITDIDWEGRPADIFWDIGADEFADGPPAPDTTPPLRSNGAPTGPLPSGTTETTISLTTNESATCKYSMTSGVSFDLMTLTLNITGGLAHSSTVTGLMDDQNYNFYIKCDDALGNANTNDFQISFDVDGVVSDITPPVRSNGIPTGALPSGTTEVDISLTTDEGATCKYSTNSGIDFDSITSTFSTTGGTSHNSNITGLTDGQTYNFYVKCEDALGNDNTDDFVITFSVNMIVDNAAPIRSNASPSGTLPAGTTQQDISLSTNENAICRYSTSSGVDFESMTSTFNTTGGTGHSSTITGLMDGQIYSYFVKCKDEFDNSNTSDFLVSFEVGEVVQPTPIMLQALTPSQTGVQNMLMAINATSNEEVLFIWGFNQEAVSADHICQGFQTHILNPRTNLQVVTADAEGRASLKVDVPQSVLGVDILIQAVDLVSCTGSNINIETPSAAVPSTLNPMVPGQAGTLNSLSANGLTPNGDVKFIWGFTEQTMTANNICFGFESGIFNPRTLAQLTANDLGHVTIDFNVPLKFLGVNVLIQAVDLSTCFGSNVTTETIDPSSPQNVPVLNALQLGAVGPNTLISTNHTPGGPVAFIWGFIEEPTSGNNLCAGLQAGIRNFRNLRTGVADQFGNITINVTVPQVNPGTTVKLQIVDLLSCTPSNVTTQTF